MILDVDELMRYYRSLSCSELQDEYRLTVKEYIACDDPHRKIELKLHLTALRSVLKEKCIVP